MADDVNYDQSGTSSKRKIRLSKRKKKNRSPNQSSVRQTKSVEEFVQSSVIEGAKSQSDTQLNSLNQEQTVTSNKRKRKTKTAKSEPSSEETNEAENSKGVSNISKAESSVESQVQNVKAGPSKLSKSNPSKKRKRGTSKLTRSISDTLLAGEESDTISLRKTRSQSDQLKGSKKRKRRELPVFSPKKLRSSVIQANCSEANTGSQSSLLRAPPQRRTTGSSNNLGSCASSSGRRNRRSRSLAVPNSDMEGDRNETTDNTESEVVANEGADDVDGPLLGAMASLTSGGSSASQDDESALGLEEGDISRLQALLEARGLPAHLFGSLGPRMHLLLHKTFNSGASTKAQQLIASMQSSEEVIQLQGVMEMCQMLVMGNEETLGGFPAKQVVPILITLLQMEHSFDIMNHACRALTYLMEALPRSSVVVVDAIPALLEKLQSIQCMDVAEQALTALEMLSKRHGKNILQAGGLGSSLLFLDFFSIVAQRSALAITANCCHSVTVEEFDYVCDSIETLSNRLTNQDKKSIESVCLAFTRLVENVQSDKVLLAKLCAHGLLANLKQLLLVSPPIISSSTFVMVIRMLAVMCANCPSIAVQLLQLDISETVQFLLVGSNVVPSDDIIELVPRSPQELYELTCLVCELLPDLPTTGIFSIESQLSKGTQPHLQSGQWQWNDDRSIWHTYLWVDNRIIEAAYQGGEDEISLSTLGRNYIIDFTNMQQINEDTGTMRAIQRKSGKASLTSLSAATLKMEEEDERAIIFKNEPEKGKALVQSLIRVVYIVYYSSVGPAVKHKCLRSALKMLYHSPSDVLREVLTSIPISSYIAGMLCSPDLRIVCSALQEIDILMSKLSDLYHVYFRREGVMHKVKLLSETVVSRPEKRAEKSIEENDSSEDNKEPEFVLRKNHSNVELSSTFHDVTFVAESSDLATSNTAAKRTEMLRSNKRRGTRKFTRQRTSKQLEDAPSTSTNPKKPPQDAFQSRSSTFSSSNSTSGTVASKRSFFANFAPRWGRSQSYQNTSSSPSPGVTEKSLKEQYNKEQEQNKDNIHLWIKETAKEFFKKYFIEECGLSHPALNILQKLTNSSKELKKMDDQNTTLFNDLCDILLNENQREGASPFEIIHSGMVTNLLRYLTEEDSKHSMRENRIQTFIEAFLKLQKKDLTNSSSNFVISKNPVLLPLVQKLNLCVNQLEQFPVKCHDANGATGARGSSALRFFNTHQIKCNLMRHPDCTVVKQWSGGAVKIDPLALVQAIERYLVVRGFGRVREDTSNEMSEDDDRTDDEIEESWATQLQGSLNGKHLLEFTLNGHVLPYNMTVYQAIRQYAPTNIEDNSDTEDYSPFGRASIWSKTHTLHFRPVNLPETKLATATKRSKSLHAQKPLSMCKIEKKDSSKDFLSDKLPLEMCSKDPSLEVICLLRVLYYLNSHWGKYFGFETVKPVVPISEFINTKLTAKATRQLQDPLIIMTGNLPMWLSELAQTCPFIFPFECRQLLFYTTTFDRDRAVMKLQGTVRDLASTDNNDRVATRLEKKKCTVNRNNLFKQAESTISEFTNSKSLLEIQYEGEVGTGLGPTLEFYTLVSKHFQRADTEMWRGEKVTMVEGEGDAQERVEYCISGHGLFPTPLPKSMKSSQLNKTKSKFRFLGKFIAKACMDSRMVDIPLSQAFFKWMLSREEQMNISDMQYVDQTLFRSLSQINEVCLAKKRLQNDVSHTKESLGLALSSLTMDGVSIEDLGLDFALPGTNIELKKGGKDVVVNIENVEEYLELVLQYSLCDGVSRQMQAFKEGFEQFFPLKNLEMFYPEEMELLFCGSKSVQWDAKDLLECCQAKHGYTADSRALMYLLEILSKYTTDEQRLFLQFITGSPKLPVGGFKSLNPPLTIVRKSVDTGANPDNYLPSVMTCVNYLKLPDYSSAEIMYEKLKQAYSEGKNAFHLS